MGGLFVFALFSAALGVWESGALRDHCKAPSVTLTSKRENKTTCLQSLVFELYVALWRAMTGSDKQDADFILKATHEMISSKFLSAQIFSLLSPQIKATTPFELFFSF